MPYERDVLAGFDPRARPKVPEQEATPGLVVEDRASGFCGDVVAATSEAVTLRDRHGNRRHFAWKHAGFLLDGRPVTLVRPRPKPPTGPGVTASGSVAGPASPARTARAARIWVEGIHDAELLEHVWGDDLRELGLVVEPLHGIDGLELAIDGFAPRPGRRLGVLVDHLVPGSKEARIAAAVRRADVLVTGHPFVDVWAGIRPRVLGRERWPDVPRGTPWKAGMASALGTDLATMWPTLRNRVRSYADLEPELVGAVERLIDFVSEG